MGRPNRYFFRLLRRPDDHTKVESTLLTKCGTLKGMGLRQEAATVGRALVSVVDDDESVRESLPALLRASGFDPRVFSSAAEFLSSDYVHRTKCLILDIAMPNMSGLELQQELGLRGQKIPIVFITAQTDDAVRVRALEQGAVSVLLKPFSKTDLLAAVKAALGTS
jgi:FixJ family two-component response regulator